MSAPQLIDFSFARPDDETLKDYDGVLRYGGAGTDSKLATPAEVAHLHGLKKVVGFVYETAANRAVAGKGAGVADRMAMEKWAEWIGYPKECPIFYATDFDAEWGQVSAYYEGVMEGATFPSGPYGGVQVVNGFAEAHPHGVSWQTFAWSDGKLSAHASIYQYGVTLHGSYNNDRVVKPVCLWGADGAQSLPKPKVKKPTGLTKLHAHYANALARDLDKRTHPLTKEARTRLETLASAIHKAEEVKP